MVDKQVNFKLSLDDRLFINDLEYLYEIISNIDNKFVQTSKSVTLFSKTLISLSQKLKTLKTTLISVNKGLTEFNFLTDKAGFHLGEMNTGVRNSSIGLNRLKSSSVGVFNRFNQDIINTKRNLATMSYNQPILQKPIVAGGGQIDKQTPTTKTPLKRNKRLPRGYYDTFAPLQIGFASLLLGGMFIDFDKQLNKIQAVTGIGGDSRKELESFIINLASKKPITTGKTAQAGTVLAKAGLGVKEIMASLPTVSDFAIAGDISPEQSAKILIANLKSRNQTINEKNIRRTADVFAKTAQVSQTDFSDLLQFNASASQISSLRGLDLYEQLSVFALGRDIGIQPNRVATNLKTISVNTARGGGNVEKALLGLGFDKRLSDGTILDANKFSKMDLLTQMSVLLESGSLRSVLDNISRDGKISGNEITKVRGTRVGSSLAKISGTEGLPLFLALLTGMHTGKFDILKDKIKNQSEGATASFVETMLKGLSGDYEKMKASIDKTLMNLGKKNGLMEDMSSFLKTITGLSDTVDGLSPEIKKIIVGGLELLAGLGAFSLSLRVLGGIFGSLVKVIGVIVGIVGGLSTAVVLISTLYVTIENQISKMYKNLTKDGKGFASGEGGKIQKLIFDNFFGVYDKKDNDYLKSHPIERLISVIEKNQGSSDQYKEKIQTQGFNFLNNDDAFNSQNGYNDSIKGIMEFVGN